MNIFNTHTHPYFRNSRLQLLVALTLTLVSIFSLNAALASNHGKHSKISIDQTWVRAIILGRPAAGYMVVHNPGAADKIISASSPAAKNIEIHTTSMTNGVMRMRRVKQVDVPANRRVEFKSGGFHLMIFGLKSSLKPGSKLPLTIVFEKAGAIKVEFVVKKSGKAIKHSGHESMDQKDMKH